MSFLQRALTPNPHKAIREEVNNHIVDTILANDTGKWETAIQLLSPRDNMKVVEVYDSEVLAIEGHERWIDIVKNGPTDKMYKQSENIFKDWAKQFLDDLFGSETHD